MRRQRLGLSLRQLVGRAGVAESTVTGALYGYHEGSVRTWWSIARALDMPIGELMAHLDDGLADAGANEAGFDVPPP
jgi:transcriptional regulator with XRE-family HTH domain